MQNLGLKIKKLRELKNLTQDHVAHELGLIRVHILGLKKATQKSLFPSWKR